MLLHQWMKLWTSVFTWNHYKTISRQGNLKYKRNWMIQWTFKIQVMEETEYSDLRPLFPPLFHVICLIYSNSNYYSSQARIIVILKVEFSALCFFSVAILFTVSRKPATWSLTIPKHTWILQQFSKWR